MISASSRILSLFQGQITIVIKILALPINKVQSSCLALLSVLVDTKTDNLFLVKMTTAVPETQVLHETAGTYSRVSCKPRLSSNLLGN